jgi:LysM repeat protein
MFFQKPYRRAALLLWTLVSLGWSGCTPAPAQETSTPTSPGMITPYWTSTPRPDTSPMAPLARTPTAPPTPTPTPVTYRVVAGDTMLGIALRFGITLEELMAANPEVDPRFLSVDTDLVIPLGESAPSALEMPTPVPVALGELICYPTAEGGAWCFWLIENEHSRPLENLSARIWLYSPAGEALREATAIPPLNLIPGDSAVPLVAYFSPGLPGEIYPQGELLTSLPVSPGDERYLNAKLEVEQVEIDPGGMQARVRGTVSLPRNSAPAVIIWLAAVARGEDGRVVGVRKWESAVAQPATTDNLTPEPTPVETTGALTLTPSPAEGEGDGRYLRLQPTRNENVWRMEKALEPGEMLPFEFTVFSHGPRILEVDVLVEARP